VVEIIGDGSSHRVFIGGKQVCFHLESLFVVEVAKVGNLVEKILHACVRYKPCHCNLSNLS